MMNESRRNGWMPAALAAVVVAIAAGIAYNVGLSQGLAQVGAAAATPSPYYYGWHRPWGFGFLFPLLFFCFFWVMVVKGLWWGRWGRWSYYGPPPHVRDRFDEWHRQAHKRMSRPPDAKT